jgi:uncharacterized protein (TIGR03790 family)
MVVINEASRDSLEIGRYYVAKRRIPKENVVLINTSTSDNMAMGEYKTGVEDRVREAIKKSRNPIDFIVTTKGVPIRLRDNAGYSLDGHLATMDLPIKAIEKPDEASIKGSLNPYFNSKLPFSSRRFGFYLVTRLDGYDREHAKKLVDNAMAAKPEKGPFFFDAAENRQAESYGEMQRLLYEAERLLKAKGFEASTEGTKAFVAPAEPLAGYASWGSNDGAFSLETYRKLRFKPGALVETYVSTSGRTFSRTEGGQSLIADLIEQGATGAKGYVSEPFTIALARPPILFDRYTSGFNLAESFYAASPILKWKDVVIGDPLCAPYAK